MADWNIVEVGKQPTLKEPILIEGLPGMGNVGKIAVDFLIESLNAKKFLELDSYNLPNSVFIDEDGLIEVPAISFYYKKTKEQDFVFLAGDIQPLDEVSSHAFCSKVMDVFESCKGKEIVTLGGIGLPNVPKKSNVYVTANDKGIRKRYMTKIVKKDIYGVVGPIIGVSGLLLGAAKKRDVKAVSLLAQTFSHPNYLGVRGAREILKILTSVLGIEIDLKELDEEIKEMESSLKKMPAFNLPKKDMIVDATQKISYIG